MVTVTGRGDNPRYMLFPCFFVFFIQPKSRPWRRNRISDRNARARSWTNKVGSKVGRDRPKNRWMLFKWCDQFQRNIGIFMSHNYNPRKKNITGSSFQVIQVVPFSSPIWRSPLFSTFEGITNYHHPKKCKESQNCQEVEVPTFPQESSTLSSKISWGWD